MMIWMLCFLFPVQDGGAPSQVKYDDLKIIEERNIFSPAKPKPKKSTPRKTTPQKPRPKKAAPNPVVRGFVRFQEGFRVLIHDPATGKENFFTVGEKVQGAEIIKTDLEKGVIRVGEEEKEIFTGSEIQRTDGSTLEGSTSTKQESSPKPSEGRSSRLEKLRAKMREKYGKKVELEEEPE